MWFIDNLGRFHIERFAIDKLIAESEWLEDAKWNLIDSKLVLTAILIVNDHTYSVQMTYPPLYPVNPPSVKPVDADDRWSSHQYEGGELCLEWGPDNWRDNITGADMLQSVYKLLESERPHEDNGDRVTEVPSRHILSHGQEIRRKVLRFSISPEIKEHMVQLANKTTGLMELHVILSGKSIVAHINTYTISESDTRDNLVIPKEISTVAIQRRGIYYKTLLASHEITTLNTAFLRERLAAEDFDFTTIDDETISLLLLISQDQQLHLFSLFDKDNWLLYETIELPNNDLQKRTGPDVENLKNSRVGIVGAGSAGSKIALSLARSGIRNFVIIDDDLFLPENICRHELTWEDVGQHKVDGISHLLTLIDPDIKVESRKIMLAGQESSATASSAITQLMNSNIIVDATANPKVFNLLSDVAYQSSTPYVWLEVFEGGIGGLIGRFRPGVEPKPTNMRAFLLEYLENVEAPKLKVIDDYSSITEENEIIVATDAAVAIISGYLTTMALDICAKHEPSQFPYSLYLIGLQKGWIFDEPFHTQPLNIENIKSDSPPEDLAPEEKEGALRFLQELLDNKKT